ncbi:MAG TPA: peptidoglycan editing factor PgeF [Candidatus Xenobia bacterium]|nr:peptidoglycan editing factor PgeF [Candidatus Xenobia bacterium]
MGLIQDAWLRQFARVTHAFTTRALGNMNYSVSKSPADVARNRRKLLRALGGRWQLITLKQRHTDIVRALDRASLQKTAAVQRERDGALKFYGDALITNRPGLLLAVQVADCLPILLADPTRLAVAAVHAGWRGTAKRIAEKTVGVTRLRFGCRPRDLRAILGPGIHVCCYEVGREVIEVFESQFPYWEKLVRRVKVSVPDVLWQQRLISREPRPPGARRPRPALTAPAEEKVYLDLVEANRRQLVAAGLRNKNIVVSPLCTACRTDLLFSHRAERGSTGRTMGLIGIRK